MVPGPSASRATEPSSSSGPSPGRAGRRSHSGKSAGSERSVASAREHALRRVHPGEPLALLPERAQAAARDHLPRRLGGDVHHTLDDPAGTAHGRVGEREVGLLEPAPAHERHESVLDPVRDLAGEHRPHHRADRVPRLREHVLRPGAERGRVLVRDQLDVGGL
jgi:hypothetical protein